MSDFEKMCRIITKFPRKDKESGEENYAIKQFRKGSGKVIYFATSDSYCWASLYFNDDGEFVGFSPEW